MALTREQSISKYGTEAYTAWGETEAAADASAHPEKLNTYKSGGSGSSASSSSAITNSFDDSAFKEALRITAEGLKPVVSAYEGMKETLPAETALAKTSLENTKTTLEGKYDALLASLTGEEGKQIGQSNLAASREFGKRGVSLQSGAYSQYLEEKTTPISEFYTGQRTSVGLEKESNLLKIAEQINALPSQEAKDRANYDLAIALAKQGSSTAAANIFMSLGSTKANADQLAASLAQNQSQFQQDQATKTSQFNQTLALDQAKADEAIREYNLDQQNAKIKAANTTSPQNYKNAAIQMAKTGVSKEKIVEILGAYMSLSEINSIYGVWHPDIGNAT